MADLRGLALGLEEGYREALVNPRLQKFLFPLIEMKPLKHDPEAVTVRVEPKNRWNAVKLHWSKFWHRVLWVERKVSERTEVQPPQRNRRRVR